MHRCGFAAMNDQARWLEHGHEVFIAVDNLQWLTQCLFDEVVCFNGTYTHLIFTFLPDFFSNKAITLARSVSSFSRDKQARSHAIFFP